MATTANFTAGATRIAVGVAMLSIPMEAAARDLTITSWGGSYQDAQRTAYFEPFHEATGTPILEESYNGGLSKIRSMVQTDSVVWDVVQMEDPALKRACRQGLLVELPWKKMGNRAQFIDGGHSTCGAGTIVWSVAMAYNAEEVDGQPSGWDDFFNVEKYPGKRALRRGAKFNLEIALMADGVPREDVYDVLRTEEGVDRAFDKLAELKPHIQWWEAGAQAPEWLAQGEVVMTSAYNGRISAAQEEGQPFKLSWDGHVYAIDSWAIVRGTPNKAEAVDFIEYASAPENMAWLPQEIPYGAPNEKANQYIPDSVKQQLPTAPDNLEKGLLNSTEFWVQNEERLDRRFQSWATN